MRRFTLLALAAVLLLTVSAAWAVLPQIKTEADASNPVAPASKAAMWDSLSIFTAAGTVRCAAVGDGDNDTDTLETFIGMSAAPRDLRMITPLTANTQRSDLITNTSANRGVQCLTVANCDSFPGNEVVFGTQQAAAGSRSLVGYSKYNAGVWTTTMIDSSWLSTVANGQQVHSIKVGDVNGDGLNEIVYAMGDTLKMLRFNASTGLFDKSIILTSGGGTGYHMYGMDIGEFDADHAGIEIVVATNYGMVIEVYWNGSGWSTSNMYVPGGQGFMSPVIGDFDPDNAGNEVAFSRFSAPTTEIYEIYGGSAGTWTTTKIFTSAAGAQCNGLVVGDFDATHAGNELAYAQYGTKQVIQLKKIAGTWYSEVTFTGGAEMTDWWGLGVGNANPYHAGDELVACNSAPATRRALRIQDRAVSTDWAMSAVNINSPFSPLGQLVGIQAVMINNSTSANKAVFLNRVNRPDGSIQANTTDSSATVINPGEFNYYSYTILADTAGKWAVAESMAVTGDSIAANDRKLGVFRAADLLAYPVNEGFETVLLAGPNWDTITVASGATAPAWSRVTVGTNPATTPHNASAGMAKFNSYDASSGGQARLVLWPAFLPTAGYNFSFWMYNWTSGSDSMLVDISTDCGATWTKVAGYPLLGTAGWSQKTISLNAYAGDTVVIALRGRSAWGNNIFVDDIALTAPPTHDFAAGRILAPSSQMMIGSIFSPSAVFNNNSSTSETGYVFAEIKDNVGATLYKDSVDQAITLFDSATVTFAPFTASIAGIDTMIFTAALAGDEVPANDQAVKTFTVNPILPLAVNESFEGVQFPPMYWDTLRYAGVSTYTWTRQTAGTNPACTPYDGAAMARYESYNATSGNQMMLVSPYIGTNNANAVRLSFAMYGDPGYATNYDSILVDVTNDDGATWTRGIAGFQRYDAAAAWRTVTANLGSFGNDTIRVALRAKSDYGNNMFVDQVSIYDVPPQITYTSPADGATGVLVNAPVVIGFSEPVDQGTFVLTTSDNTLNWLTSWNAGGDTVTLTHDPFAVITAYTITVTVANDLAGNPLAAGAVPNPFTFTTNADGTPPTIVSTTPADGAIDVALNTPVVVAFSEPMNTGSIIGYAIPTDNYSLSWNAAGDTLTLTPGTPYAYSTEYSIILTAATDLAGYSVPALPDTFVTFTTIANQGPAITMTLQPGDTYDGTGPFMVRAVITDPAKAGAKQGIASTTLYYSLNGLAWNSGAGVPMTADTFNFGIGGGLSAGTLVSYYILAADDMGDSVYSPANAPIGVYSFRILNPLAPTALAANGLDMAVDLSWAPPSQILTYSTGASSFYGGLPAGFITSTRYTPMHYPCRLEQATSIWYNSAGMDSVIVHVYADDGTGMPDEATQLVTPFRILPQEYPTATVIDLSGYNIILASGEFHIGYEMVTTGMPAPVGDGVTAGPIRSLYKWTDGFWYGDLEADWSDEAAVSYSSYTKGLALKSSHLRKGQKPNYVMGNGQNLKPLTIGHKQAVLYPTLSGAMAMVKNLQNYSVFRGDVTGGPYTLIGTAGTPTYLDVTDANGTPYFYVVRAEYATPDTFSANSNEATATPAALSILLVSDAADATDDAEAIYTAAVDAAGYSGQYTVCQVGIGEDGPSAAWFSGRTHVIWWTGDGYQSGTTIRPNDETNLAAYLNAGGKLFLSAQDYLYDAYSSAGYFAPGQFPYDYLGVDSVTQDEAAYEADMTISGYPTELSMGQSFLVEEENPQWIYADNLVKRNVAEAHDIFTVSAKVGEIPGVGYANGTFRTVFFTFPFENLQDGTSPSTKGELMYRILNWLATGVEGKPTVDAGMPASFNLAANFPNPVKGHTTVKFALPKAGRVNVTVYNVTGQKVKTLVDGNMDAGYHSVNWNGRNESGQKVSAGVYLYQMQAGNFSTARKLVVVR